MSLVELGYQHAEESWAAVADFLDSTWVAALQPEGRRRLEAFLPLLCEMAAATREPDSALTRSLPFVRAVCRRSAYLVLENPRALQHLLTMVLGIWLSERLAAPGAGG